jgi:hypothetical protein
VKQKANSGESLNLNTQDEKLIFTNDKKQQQSADSNSGAWTGGHELEKGLSPIVAVSKLTGQNTKPKTTFQHRSIGSTNMLAKS